VILVVNKSDEGRATLDERGLLLKYPVIQAIIHTSCTEGTGVAELRQAIRQALATMPHLNDHLPLTWFEVKEKLLVLDKDTLPYENYIELCQAEHVTHETAQRALARFLHDLGAALNFQDDRRLAATYVLNPEWVTGGIYQILTADFLRRDGILHLPALDQVLDCLRYPPEKHPFLLDIMRRFELCVPLGDGERYLIPGLLPKERPFFDWPENVPPALEYRYAILPAAVLSRLMVRLHRHTWQKTRWRNCQLSDRVAQLVFTHEPTLFSAKQPTLAACQKLPFAFPQLWQTRSPQHISIYLVEHPGNFLQPVTG
jgi:internalin A